MSARKTTKGLKYFEWFKQNRVIRIWLNLYALKRSKNPLSFKCAIFLSFILESLLRENQSPCPRDLTTLRITTTSERFPSWWSSPSLPPSPYTHTDTPPTHTRAWTIDHCHWVGKQTKKPKTLANKRQQEHSRKSHRRTRRSGLEEKGGDNYSSLGLVTMKVLLLLLVLLCFASAVRTPRGRKGSTQGSASRRNSQQGTMGWRR